MNAQQLNNIALVVDDDPATLRMVVEALEGSGMTVLVARDGSSALELSRRVGPDVILLDAMMPRLDGFETCRQLKAPPASTSAPVIFMTGLTEPEDILKGLRSGAVDYITKPIDVEELIARLTIHMVNSKLIQSAREAIELSGPAVMAFNTSGTFAWGSPRATQMMPNVGQVDAVEERLAAWIRVAATTPISEVVPMSFEGHILRAIGLSTVGEVLIRVAPAQSSSNEKQLEMAFGLTEREAEVLFWLTLGKTNRDIGDILDLSSRTVNKHLEAVFQKLGVDNRTTAAVRADRILHSQ
ncbi:MAG: DNA-binding response regulator [Pseudomonadota bacterium]